MAIGRIPEPGTSIPESIIAAKGDLIVGTANDAPGILSVGTNGHTLVADSSVSPTGLKWAVDPVADVVTTAGDLIYATAADTVARLGIGTAGQVLKVNSGATAPEWGAAAAGGANWSLVNSGGTTLTGAATITVSGISNADKIMVVLAQASSASASSLFKVRLNADSNLNYSYAGPYFNSASTYSVNNLGVDYAAATDGIPISKMGNDAGDSGSGFALISGCNATGLKIYNAAGEASGTTSNGYITGGFYSGSTAISSVSVNSGTGNFDNGTVFVYTSA